MGGGANRFIGPIARRGRSLGSLGGVPHLIVPTVVLLQTAGLALADDDIDFRINLSLVGPQRSQR